MDITHKDTELKKEAQLSALTSAFLAKKFFDGYLPFALLSGTIIGSTAGLGASMLKSKDPDTVELNRKKKFYESKVDEMNNENWLNEVLSIKKRLETERMPDDERKSLESKYVELLNK